MAFMNTFQMLIPIKVSNQLRTIAEHFKQTSEIPTYIYYSSRSFCNSFYSDVTGFSL